MRFYSISAALNPPFPATGRRERGRLGCARLGTGTNSSLPCSGRFSGPVRDSPNGCKGARVTSELICRDKGAKRVRRDPSLRGKGVGRVSPPGPACGGASPPGTFSGLPGQSQLGRERGPGGGRSDRERPSPAWASYCRGMEELCPGAVPRSPRGVGTGKGLPAAPQPDVHPFPRGKELPGAAPEAPKGQRLPARRDVLAPAQGLPRPGPGARPAPAFSWANTSPGARPGAENRPNSRELAQVPPGTPAGLGEEG
ncbi:collagen alpha-1(I) chain-like [Pipra filicauda]|uniref:Collagen alpha-1(I) chain-like n=1 Tax=Pipra filicauda TaxID=649802 RepID=A0A6J2FYY7_9PASS|nr:collagen alpha-1(I) chain-like [Pipra filicauda]